MKYVICPHLKGSSEGAVCCVINNLIRDIEDVSIRLCLNRHYEACAIYKSSLQMQDLVSAA